MLQICDNVINVLCPDRKPNRCRTDTGIQQFLCTELRVGGRRRMNNQRLDICHVCKQRKQFQRFGEFFRLLFGAV